MFLAFRSFTTDVILAWCFAKSVNAMDAPNFRAPVISALEAAIKGFKFIRNFEFMRRLNFYLPPWLVIKMAPEMAGLVRLHVELREQVKDVCADPESMQSLPYPIIYSRLLDPAAQKGYDVPNETSLYEEAATLVFGGGDTVGNTLMVGFFHITRQPALHAQLREEVRTVWPNIHDPPLLEAFESLPLLTATIKESLRVAPGVSASTLRTVPASGALISGHAIPGGTDVGISMEFVHKAPTIWTNPQAFDVSRWMQPNSTELEHWMVAFSRGPRSCIGINLAWCELYIAFATMLRRFEMEAAEDSAEELVFRDGFLPHFYGKHLQLYCRPVEK